VEHKAERVPCAPPLDLAERTRAARRSPPQIASCDETKRPRSTNGATERNGDKSRFHGPELLTQNQMFGSRGPSVGEPTTEEPPELHQLVHQRLRTTMDILGPNPKIRPDHGRIRTSRWVLLPTTEQKASCIWTSGNRIPDFPNNDSYGINLRSGSMR
jgi:hypothetical protein